MKTYILKYAVIGAVAKIVLGLLNWFLIAPYFSVRTSQGLGYLGITLAMLCIPMAIRYYRDRLNAGQVTFSHGLVIGLSITFIVAAIMFFYGMLFFVLQGDVFQEWQLKDLQGEELAAMKARLASLPDFAMTPWFQGIILSVMSITAGFVMTLVSALILKRAGSKMPAYDQG